MTRESLIVYLHNTTKEDVDLIKKLMDLKEDFLLDRDILNNS